MFDGKLSPLFCNFSSLDALDLSDNKISGKIPLCLGKLNNSLSILNLRNNSFEGKIPQVCKTAGKLKYIDVSYNQLQGQLPRTLSNCSMLESIDVSYNVLYDVFPSLLGALSELKLLFLRRNVFYGEIREAKSGFEFPKLRVIDLSHNNFKGKLTYEYFRDWNAMKAFNASNSKYLEANSSYHLNVVNVLYNTT